MSLPRATYRLQFRQGMDFDRAAGLAAYLAHLGVSHLYASPLFQAVPGSSHGYDVIDHNRFDDSLGGIDGFLRLSAALKTEGLGLIVDIVPNHMAASPHNPWWRDVLRHGRESRYAGHFDIDWATPRLLLPVLEAPFGTVLQAYGFSLGLDGGEPCWTYREMLLPLAPSSWRMLVQPLAEALRLPETDLALEHLAAWIDDPVNARRLEGALQALGRDRQLLDRLHGAQHWRLAYWRAGRDTLNYRRFFEVSDLVGVRVEDEGVFADVHRLLFEMLTDGHIDGLRIDHIDGLADPTAYLRRLREAAPGSPPIWVEKILAPGEDLPVSWSVAGTTGYEFARLVGGLLTDAAGEPALSAAYHDFVGEAADAEVMLAEAKREILTYNLAAELALLHRLLIRVVAADAAAGDWGPDTLRRALIAIAMAMPVYRTYLDAEPATAADTALLEKLEQDAVRICELDDPTAVSDVLRLLREGHGDDAQQLRRRFQQTTGALMAKAMEDTLFYRYSRLLSANEVGGEPSTLGLDPGAFDLAIAARARRQPAGLNATATHDTKRGEDARMRIAAIADDPKGWSAAVRDLDALLAGSDDNAPDPEMRWHFYQALLGAWRPGDLDALRERLTAYMLKAAREAKRFTRWTRIDRDYELRLSRFVARALTADTDFPDRFQTLASPFITAGERKSLVQLALKLTLPGIPDLYQGTEWADLSLVDPDNRRPVDFATRMASLEDGLGAVAEFEGKKLALLRRLLKLQQEHPKLFANGSYRPLEPVSDSVKGGFAFVRAHDEKMLLVLCQLRSSSSIASEKLRFSVPEFWHSATFIKVVTGTKIVRSANSLSAHDGFAAWPVAVAIAQRDR